MVLLIGAVTLGVHTISKDKLIIGVKVLAMNEAQIRQSFHHRVLGRHHACANTLVVDELGLKHGRCRADIAVINGYLNGFEIKSDRDSLFRLSEQVVTYGAVFDRITAIVAERHLSSVQEIVPDWWGLIVCFCGPRGAVKFWTKKKPSINRSVDPFSVAQLLWSHEAREILGKKAVSPRVLRQSRAVLYGCLTDLLSMPELRRTVRAYLMARKNWRCHKPALPDDDLSQPSATY